MFKIKICDENLYLDGRKVEDGATVEVLRDGVWNAETITVGKTASGLTVAYVGEAMFEVEAMRKGIKYPPCALDAFACELRWPVEPTRRRRPSYWYVPAKHR